MVRDWKRKSEFHCCLERMLIQIYGNVEYGNIVPMSTMPRRYLLPCLVMVASASMLLLRTGYSVPPPMVVERQNQYEAVFSYEAALCVKMCGVCACLRSKAGVVAESA